MPPTSTARTRAQHGTRRVAAPRHPRRLSGPIARPVPATGLPRIRSRGSTGVFERLRALPEHRLLDRLLRGRVWIWLIGLMLGGIVAMQVSLLKLNAGISHSVEQAGALERVNADLETEVARLSSGERIQLAAADEGMVAPPAGDVGYVTARPGTDARLAVQRMQSPSDEAQQVMAAGGRAPVELAPPTLVPAETEAVAPTAIAPAAVTPAVSPSPAATPAPIVTPAPTPAPEAVAPAGTSTGATTAPTG